MATGEPRSTLPRRTRRSSKAIQHTRPRARRLPPAERRQHLLTCALRVFARRGIGEARHAQVAHEAQVALATVFVYFPTRQALVEAVLDEVARFYVEMAQRIHSQRDLAADQVLLQHAREFSASVARHQDYARVWLDWSTSIRDPFWSRYLEFQQKVVELIVATIERGQREGSLRGYIDPRFAALFVVSAAHMVAQLQFSHQPPEVVEGFLRTLVGTVTSGKRNF